MTTHRFHFPDLGNSITAGLAIFIGVALCSCDFEFPAGEKITQDLDPRLLGKWFCRSESEKSLGYENYTISKGKSGDEMIVVVDGGFEFLANRIDAAVPGLLQLKLERAANEDGKWAAAPGSGYSIVATRFEGDELVFKRLKAPESKELKDESQVAAHLAQALKSLDWSSAAVDDDKTSLWKTRRLERSSEAAERVRKLRAELEEKGRELKAVDDKLAELKDRQAATVSKLEGGPWPPADLIFRDAADWHRRMCDAPVLDRPSFLKQVKKVRLEINITRELGKLISENELWLMAAKAAHSEGFEVDPHAGVKMVVTIKEDAAENVVREDGMVVSRVPFAALIFELKFTVPARALRGGNFYHMEVSPAGAMVFGDKVGRYDEDTLRKRFPTSIAKCMATMRGAGLHWEGREAWMAKIGPLEKAEERYLAYKTSRREKRDEFARTYTGLDRMAGVIIGLENQASDLIEKSELEKAWAGGLANSGMKRQELGSPALRYWLFANYHGPKDIAGALFTSEHRDHWTFVEHFILSDTSVVYDLNGNLFQGLVDLSLETTAGFALKADMPKALGRHLAGTVEEFERNAQSLR